MVLKAQSTAEVAVLLVAAQTSLGLFLVLGGGKPLVAPFFSVEESGGKGMILFVGGRRWLLWEQMVSVSLSLFWCFRAMGI